MAPLKILLLSLTFFCYLIASAQSFEPCTIIKINGDTIEGTCKLKRKDNYLISDQKLTFSYKKEGQKFDIQKDRISKISTGGRIYNVHRNSTPNHGYQLRIYYAFAHTVVSGDLTIARVYTISGGGGRLWPGLSGGLYKVLDNGLVEFISYDHDLRNYAKHCPELNSYVDSLQFLGDKEVVEGYKLYNEECSN